MRQQEKALHKIDSPASGILRKPTVIKIYKGGKQKPRGENNMNKELKEAIENYDSCSVFERSYGYCMFFQEQMKVAKTEAEKKSVWDALILVNSNNVQKLSEKTVIKMMGYRDEDMIEDLYQEGMLLITQKVNSLKSRSSEDSFFCYPTNLMFGMNVDLMEKLLEIRGPFKTVSIYDFIDDDEE